MARSKPRKKSGEQPSSRRARKQGAGKADTPPEQPRSRPLREIRPYVYAGFDFAMLMVYAILFISVVPSRHASAVWLARLMMISATGMGVAMFVRNRWGWRAAVAGCGALLILAVVLMVLILMSSAFLAGVYGAFGKAASMFALLAAALVIEVMGLLPAFQLKFLMTRAGRRYFRQEPLWR